MNLIGHYVCASHSAPPVRIGSVLPDLLTLYRRKVRPLALMRQWEAAPERSPWSDGLLAGLRFHHEVDSHFHRSPLFMEASAGLQSRLLEASRSPGLKRFLPAHVLAELYFDHLAMAADPCLAGRYHADLAAGRDQVTEFVAAHPLADAESFGSFLSHILTDRFVDDYRHIEGILYRMNRILARFSQRTLEPAEEAAVTGYFTEHAAATAVKVRAFHSAMAAHCPGGGPKGERSGPEGERSGPASSGGGRWNARVAAQSG